MIHRTAVQVSRRKKKSSKNLYFLHNQLHDQLQPQSFKIPLSKLVRKIDIVSIPSTMRRKNNRNKQIRKHVNGICSILLDGKLETVVHACRGKVSADYVYGRLCSLVIPSPGGEGSKSWTWSAGKRPTPFTWYHQLFAPRRPGFSYVLHRPRCKLL